MNNMSLRNRLLLMVLIPLAGMLWVSGWNTVEKIWLAGDMTRMQGLVEVSTRIGALVHELQKERGMSAGFMGSKGANFAAELPVQRAASDKRLDELNARLQTFDAAVFGAEFGALLGDAKKRGGELRKN